MTFLQNKRQAIFKQAYAGLGPTLTHYSPAVCRMSLDRDQEALAETGVADNLDPERPLSGAREMAESF